MQIFPPPHNSKLITSDGYMSQEWLMFFNNLHQSLGQTVNEDGHVIPSQPTTTIEKIPADRVGNLVYDTTANVLKVNINGVIRTVTTAP